MKSLLISIVMCAISIEAICQPSTGSCKIGAVEVWICVNNLPPSATTFTATLRAIADPEDPDQNVYVWDENGYITSSYDIVQYTGTRNDNGIACIAFEWVMSQDSPFPIFGCGLYRLELVGSSGYSYCDLDYRKVHIPVTGCPDISLNYDYITGKI